MTGGVMWFPRMLEKIRLHARGELTEDYHANLGEGMDKRCIGFLRVEYPALRERVDDIPLLLTQMDRMG